MRYPEIAKRFNHILSLRNMKARELAKRADMTEAAISHYVNGNRCPKNDIAVKLANILGCDPAWLMDLSDNMYSEGFFLREIEENERIISIANSIMKLPKQQQDYLLTIIEMLLDLPNSSEK